MSDTPRTDAALLDAFLKHSFPNASFVHADFANQLERELAQRVKDAKRLDWLEEHHTLHKQVEILYVVDGYEVTLMHEDGLTELSPRFHGETLRAAIDKAMSDLAPTSKTVRDDHDEALEMDRERTRRLKHLGWCSGLVGQHPCMECVASRHFLRALRS